MIGPEGGHLPFVVDLHALEARLLQAEQACFTRRRLLENSANICAKRRRVAIEIRGQNGRRVKEAPTMGTSCKKHKKKRRRARHSRRR